MRAISSALRRLDWRTAAAFGLPFALYLLTLAPTIYSLDSAELTTAAHTGGLMRATGYPLYLAIGALWSRLPVGDVGYRMNLFSAFCGALTLALAWRILRRWEVGGWPAFAALGLLATAPFFWGLSLVAEVYTLHTALMAALILALLRWQEQPVPARLALVGLIGGLGMSHHMAMALLVPGSLWFVLTAAPKRFLTARSLAAAALGTLLGLSAYLYLPLRYAAGPAFNYAGTYDANLVFHPVNLQSAGGLWWLVSGQAFGAQMLAYRGAELWGQTAHFLAQLGQSFLLVGLAPGALGVWLLFRRNWQAGGMLALMFALSAAFYINYRVIDKDTMYLPAYLAWALWLGVGLQGLLAWAGAPARLDQRPPELRWMYAVMAAVVVLAAAWNWRLVDLSNDWSARRQAEAILRNAQPNALVFGWWDTAPVIQYLQLVEGQRPDVQAVNRFLIAPDDLKRVIQKESPIRPIYIDSLTDDLLLTFNAEPVGPVYRIIPQAQSYPPSPGQSLLRR